MSAAAVLHSSVQGDGRGALGPKEVLLEVWGVPCQNEE